MTQDIYEPPGNIENHDNKNIPNFDTSDVFDKMLRSDDLKDLLYNYSQLCQHLKICPGPMQTFYPTIKDKIKFWKANTLWNCLDKHYSHKVYENGNACKNQRVLIVGAGPCGLRAAIEAQLLGAKVTVIEKRKSFSRNNVVKLWPFVIQDLKNLGAKVFHGKLGTGDIEHISIKKLQFILLKISLFLGVEFFDGTCYEELIYPSRKKPGWFVKVKPIDHPVNKCEVDVIISADGNKQSVKGFKGSEMRGALAIAITANFVNNQLKADVQAEEICGVSAIYKQDLFKNMKETTGIDLENIVYYKGDTHYFVMTAKKQSLLDKGVILNDTSNSNTLLHSSNVSKLALIDYVKNAAIFATQDQLPHLEFEKNLDGEKDVAIFDFTNMWQAENSCQIIERRGRKLLLGLVGDSLLQPFWPTGSGIAKGFFSCFDMCWMMKQFNSEKSSSLEIIVQRESLFRMLPQMTTANIIKNVSNYSLDPSTRYVNINKGGFFILDSLALLDTDAPDEVKMIIEKTKCENIGKKTSDSERFSKQDKMKHISGLLSIDTKKSFTLSNQKLKKVESIMSNEFLISWFKNEVSCYPGISVNMSSLKDGTVLCALLHQYRPHLIDFYSLDKSRVAENNDRAFKIFENEFGIKPLLAGRDMVDYKKPNSFKLILYLTQVKKRLTEENKTIIGIKNMNIWSIENQKNYQQDKQNSHLEVKIDISGSTPLKKEKSGGCKSFFLVLYAIQMVLSLAAMIMLYMYNAHIPGIQSIKIQTLAVTSSLDSCFNSESNLELKEDYKIHYQIFLSVSSLTFIGALIFFIKELLQNFEAFSCLKKGCMYYIEVFVCSVFILLWLGSSNVLSYTGLQLSYECQSETEPETSLLWIAAILGFIAMLLYLVILVLLSFEKRSVRGNKFFKKNLIYSEKNFKI